MFVSNLIFASVLSLLSFTTPDLNNYEISIEEDNHYKVCITVEFVHSIARIPVTVCSEGGSLDGAFDTALEGIKSIRKAIQ